MCAYVCVRVQAAPEIVRRWVSEVQTVLTGKSDMVQYHALSLMRCIKQNDKLAISKVRCRCARVAVTSAVSTLCRR